MMKRPVKTVIFDYSGTLSLGAVAFGRPANLTEQFTRTGLARFGVDRPEIFWEKIVYPTWHIGSTSPVTYKTLLIRQIAALNPGMDRNRKRYRDLVRAVHRFAGNYLTAAAIDPGWSAVLHRLHRQSATRVLIATDHYLEATSHIIAHLAALRIRACPLGRIDATSKFLIANSAQLRHHKNTANFWRQIAHNLSFSDTDRVLLIDDFGSNEQTADRYAEPAVVTKRRATTIRAMRKTLGVPIQVHPFYVDAAITTPQYPHAVRQQIRHAITVINRFDQAARPVRARHC